MQTLTLEAAKSRHSGAHILVIDRWHEGTGRPAIYVWPSEQASVADDGARALAVYWLAETIGNDE